MRILIALPLLLALAACSDFRPGALKPTASTTTAPTAPTTASTPPVPRPDSIASAAPSTNTVGEGDPFQTGLTNPDEDGTDTAAAPAREGQLGSTTATLGDATQGGFWLKTPLVSTETTGRIVYLASGRDVRVTLIPSGGPAGGGSQISLAAMRLLDIPLTDFPELIVYAGAT